MKKFIQTGVIGHPIKHSKSPLIHNYWIDHYDLKGRYEAIDIHPDDLINRLPVLFKEEGYTGFNLTIPHKEIVLAVCDEIDDVARDIGAVNTVTFKDEKIIGTNTDAYGFVTNVKETLPHFNFNGIHATILGAGGAARAIVYGLLKENVSKIYLTNRTQAKATQIKNDFNNDPRIEIMDWDSRENILDKTHLLVNTTSLGMDGQAALNIDLSPMIKGGVVCDIVYAPLMTPLLSQAKANELSIVTGIGMLLHQARPAFKAWYGIMPEVDAMLENKVLAT